MNQPARILAVDDDPDIRRVFAQLLRKDGHEVWEAATGEEGLQLARERRPDLVLLDVMLPGLNGVDVCRQIKADPALTDVFVVLISGTAISAGEKAGGLDIGADDYLVKTVEWHEFRARIRTILRLRDAVAALRASEQHYRQLLELLPDAVTIIDLQGRFIAVNPRGVAMFGHDSEADLLRRNAFDVTLPADHGRVKADIAAALENGVVRNLEYLIQKKNGEQIPVEFSAAMLKNPQGRPFGLLSVAREITERKRAEAVLRASEERFRQLAENIREVFWMTDAAKNEMIYISPGYEEIWGQTCASLYASPRNWMASIHPQDRGRVREAAQTKQISGDYDEVYRVVRPDGSIRWIQDRAFPIRDETGQVYRVVGIADDITDRKQAEEALRESEARAGAIMQAALDAIITIDHGGRVIEFNSAAARMFGYPRNRILGQEMAAVMIPPSLHDWFNTGLASRFAAEHGPVLGSRFEITALRAHRVEFPVEFTITRVELDGPPMFTAFFRDISGRRRAEARLASLAHAIETTSEPIYITDTDNHFTFVNRAFQKAYGYLSGEVLGKTPELLLSPRNPPSLSGEILEQTRLGGWRGEIFHLRKDGREFPVFLSTSQVKDQSGRVIGLMRVAQDITERRRAEEELRQLPRRIIEAQEAERLRVARELHDSVNQLIASAKMRLRKVEDSVAAINPAAREILGRCYELMVQALEENRRIAHNLRPSDLDEFGLAEACRNFCNDLRSRVNLAVKCHISRLDRRLPAAVELNLFRIVQEAVSNVERHARAKTVRLRITFQENSITLRIQDDGRGFDPRGSRSGKGRARGIGLTNMRERAVSLGGTCTIESAPKQGTVITVKVPCEKAA